MSFAVVFDVSSHAGNIDKDVIVKNVYGVIMLVNISD